MAKQRMVNTKFWSDSFVVDELNALDRYLFLYLLTNEKTNIIGIYELSLRTASFETGIEKDNLANMLNRLSPKVEYRDGWVYIRRFTMHQQSNPSVDKGMMREFFNLPQNVIDWVKATGVDSPKLSTAFDILGTASIQPVTASDSVPVTKPKPKPNLNLNLTKPTVSNDIVVPPNRLEPVSTELIITMLAYWELVMGMNVDTVGNRRAVAALLRQKNLDEPKLKQLVDGAALALDDKYAPRISDYVSLKRKMNDLLVWGRKRNSTGENVVVIS